MVRSVLTARPTVPRPKTATMDPGSTFAVFQTAPRPEKQQNGQQIQQNRNKRFTRSEWWN